MDEKLINVKEAATLCQVTRQHIYAQRNVIGIAPGMPPKAIIFREQDVIAWRDRIKGAGAGRARCNHPWTDEEFNVLRHLMKRAKDSTNCPRVVRQWLFDAGMPSLRKETTE